MIKSCVVFQKSFFYIIILSKKNENDILTNDNEIQEKKGKYNRF